MSYRDNYILIIETENSIKIVEIIKTTETPVKRALYPSRSQGR